MIHVVQSFAVCQQFRNSVCRSFEWFSSISLSAIVRLQLLVQFVRAVCRFAVADQYSPAQPTKHVSRSLGFFTIEAMPI